MQILILCISPFFCQCPAMELELTEDCLEGALVERGGVEVEVSSTSEVPPPPPPQERLFCCKYCSRSFRMYYHFREHLRTHAGPKFTCKVSQRTRSEFLSPRAQCAPCQRRRHTLRNSFALKMRAGSSEKDDNGGGISKHFTRIISDMRRIFVSNI